MKSLRKVDRIGATGHSTYAAYAALVIWTVGLMSCGPSKGAKQAATNQLFEEVKVCNLPSVREQVRLGADVNGRKGNDGETPLMIAAQGGKP